MILRGSLIATLPPLDTQYVSAQSLHICTVLLIALPVRLIRCARRILLLSSFFDHGRFLSRFGISWNLLRLIHRVERILVHVFLHLLNSRVCETIKLHGGICLYLGHSTEHIRIWWIDLLHSLILRRQMIKFERVFWPGLTASRFYVVLQSVVLLEAYVS